MLMPAFKSFDKIEQIGKLYMTITQKIHGTNAHVLVYTNEAGELDLLVGSRNRYITPDDDNFGFATHVYAHKEEFLKLGLGRHDGEWAGPGINKGEGLAQKTFVLFDARKFPEGRPLPPQTAVVPVLYKGTVDFIIIQEALADLKTNGSKLVPGFMHPEGIVAQIGGIRYKKVFTEEDTQWSGTGKKPVKLPKDQIDYTHLCQPVRLEKLLSKDEKYKRDYPMSLKYVVQDYIADLLEENQIVGTEDEMKIIRKGASSQIFTFIKQTMEAGGFYP